MEDCLFCKIATGDIPARIAYRDDRVVAFHDITPQAPVHLLIIPIQHIGGLLEVGADHQELIGHMLMIAARLARELGVADSGFRVVINTNRGAGQSVFHLHAHVLGGRALGWPPG